MFKKLYDLTHKITEETYHPSGFPFFQAYHNYRTEGCRSARLTMSLHCGTHLDTPWHFVENGKRLDDFHVKDFMGSAIVVDLSDKYGPEVAKSKPIIIEDLENKLGEANLEIKEGDMVIINTGWHKIFSSEPLRYYRDYCTLSAEAGAWLASKKLSYSVLMLVMLMSLDFLKSRHFCRQTMKKIFYQIILLLLKTLAER